MPAMISVAMIHIRIQDTQMIGSIGTSSYKFKTKSFILLMNVH